MSDNSSNLWRTALEASAGALAAVPAGICLYFGSTVLWAEAVTILALPLALIPYVGTHVMDWLNFSPGATALLIAVVVATEGWLCRVLARRHSSAFAYTQAVLSLAVSSPFFYWTLAHRKPMLPFWGQ